MLVWVPLALIQTYKTSTSAEGSTWSMSLSSEKHRDENPPLHIIPMLWSDCPSTVPHIHYKEAILPSGHSIPTHWSYVLRHLMPPPKGSMHRCVDIYWIPKLRKYTWAWFLITFLIVYRTLTVQPVACHYTDWAIPAHIM